MHNQNYTSFPLFYTLCVQDNPLTNRDPKQPPPTNSNYSVTKRTLSAKQYKVLEGKTQSKINIGKKITK